MFPVSRPNWNVSCIYTIFHLLARLGLHERIHTMLQRNTFVLNLDERASQGLLGIMSRQWVRSLLLGVGVGYSTAFTLYNYGKG